MRKLDLKTQNEISTLVGFLSSLDEEVISDDDYLLIKSNNLNIEGDLRTISDAILKPWFLEYKPANRDKVIQSIDFIVSGKVNVVDVIFSEVNFTFEYEIKDKSLFLKRVKHLLEEYARCSG